MGGSDEGSGVFMPKSSSIKYHIGLPLAGTVVGLRSQAEHLIKEEASFNIRFMLTND